jgi:hypothetical protein
MGYRLDIRTEDGHLSVKAIGARTRENVIGMAQKMVETCHQNRVDIVLVDIREVPGRLSVFDSFALASKEFMELKKKGAVAKAALVDVPERRERSNFFNRATKNLGLNSRIFEREEDALKWLQADRQATKP